MDTMPRERKTVSVEAILAKANRALATEHELNTPDFRRGVIAVLETVLQDANRYRGFRYPGGWVEGVTDETRRAYY